MNILTFDIEDWYNCDFISHDYNWDKYEVRIYAGVDRILEALDKRDLKGTFFCLGWLADHHPEIIRRIHDKGHHIGVHSYQHELVTEQSAASFRKGTLRTKQLIENIIGENVNAYRAPGFSITENNIWALHVLKDLGFEYDCSLFPAKHDYGGFPSYGHPEPVKLQFEDGTFLKEFPINTTSIMGKNIVFSGGGFFRLFPYQLIKRWMKRSDYVMTYFHPRDFDPEQPMVHSLPLIRKFKSYVGLKRAFSKFELFLDDFETKSLIEADKLITWDKQRGIKIKDFTDE